MKVIGIVEGSEACAKPVVIGKDTVYVHTNIEKVTENDPVTGEPREGLYRYHEVQYDLHEYIQLMEEENQELDRQLTETQLALVELYESKGE